MIKIVQISAIQLSSGTPPVQYGKVFCLLEDGTLAAYDVAKDEWTMMPMPSDYDTRAIGVVADTRIPHGLELIHNVQTKMWSWRKKGTNETGDVFDGKEDAINDAKQRAVIESTEQPELEQFLA
jgi:hypothetical protein